MVVRLRSGRSLRALALACAIGACGGDDSAASTSGESDPFFNAGSSGAPAASGTGGSRATGSGGSGSGAGTSAATGGGGGSDTSANDAGGHDAGTPDAGAPPGAAGANGESGSGSGGSGGSTAPPQYLPCNTGNDCKQYGGGKICCDVGVQRFCTKQSGCSGQVIP